MSEVKKDEYIEISLTKMLIALYKNKKAFLSIMISGCVITFATAILQKPSYIYSQMLQVPSYFGEDGHKTVITSSKMSSLMNSVLKEYQQNIGDKNIGNTVTLESPVVKNSTVAGAQFFTLKSISGIGNKVLVSQTFDTISNYFSKSPLINSQVFAWKNSVESSLKLNKSVIAENNKYLSSLNTKSVSSNKKDSILSLQNQQKLLEISLNTLQPTVDKLGGFTYDMKSKNLTTKIIIGGVILSVFIALFMVFVNVIIKETVSEYKKQN